jgi:TonB family protein
MKNCVLLFIFCLPYFLFSQDIEKIKKQYASLIPSDEKELDINYQHVFTMKNNNLFIKRTYFPEIHQITHYTEYSNKKFTIKNGIVKEWWDDGIPRFEGQYENDKKSGKWIFYNNKTSKIDSSGNYHNGIKIGTWLIYNDSSYAEVQYSNSGKDYVKLWYDSSNNLKSKLIYKNDILIERESIIDSTFLNWANPLNIIKPSFVGGDKALFSFLGGNVRYPVHSRNNGVEGTSISKFVINKDGKISDITVLRGICADIKAEAMRVISVMPAWFPGENNGKKVKVTYTIPIAFKIQ